MIRGNGRSEPAGKADAFQIGGVDGMWNSPPVTMRVISIGVRNRTLIIVRYQELMYWLT